MTAGEKIKLYRNLKKVSQKTLAERSGVSEIAIRKYEAGTRNPKPEQLKKIAHALGMGENIFWDIPLNKLTIDTVGEVMALLLLLEEKVGCTYFYELDEGKNIDCSTFAIHFNNEIINKYLVRWLTEKCIVEGRKHALNMAQGQMDPEDIEQQLAIDSSLLEMTKQEFIENEEPLPPKNK